MTAACWMFSPFVSAETSVSGVISSNVRWTLEGSPYLLSGDVQIQNGALLSIDPGVSVYMGPDARLLIQSGNVKAEGTQTRPIQVLSYKARMAQVPAPGDWQQWVFTAGSNASQLDYVVFEHGRGLAVNSSAPVFNNLVIRNHLGAAITVDLAASLSGAGNSASGNTLNGVAVPAGDVVGDVKWGLKGIPYVVASGLISVGISPLIKSVTPNSIQQGQTLTLALEGTRLDSLSQIMFSKPGLTATVFSGGSSAQKYFQLTSTSDTPIGAVDLRALTDLGEIFVPNAFDVTQMLPSITSLNPIKVMAGVGPTDVVITGQNFLAASEVLFNSAAVPTRFVSSTELVGSLPKQVAVGTLNVQVRSPDGLKIGQSLLSNGVGMVVEAPVPPVLSFDITPIALPPDNTARQIILRLSKPDYRDNTLNISVADSSKARVSPASLTIPAGQTEAKVTIVPLVTGTTSVVVDSVTLAKVLVPLFITADFRGASTAYAAPVGVVVEAPAGQVTQQITLNQPPVGVSVGAVLTDVGPSAWALGSVTTLSISGFNIPSSATVSMVPSTGVDLGLPQVSADGKLLEVPVTTAVDAPVGPRRLVVKTATGTELVFADPAKSVVQLMAGLPSILSISPTYALPGTLTQLKVRGKNLDQAQIRVIPDTGVNIDTAPRISAGGEELVVSLEVLPGAPTGPRVVQVLTPAGASTAEANAANTLLIARSQKELVTPVASPVVGVLVGNGGAQLTRQEMPLSALVGVVLGAAATDVAPQSGVIGNDVLVKVRGLGLTSVSAVAFAPATGLMIQGAPAISADGTELTFTVRIAADAPLSMRRLVLTAAGQQLLFAREADAHFLVSAPVPELSAVTPTVLLAGQAASRMSVRGKNLSNVQAVRIEPTSGVTVSGPFESNADGTQLDFTVQVAASASSGDRAVVVTTPAGDSMTSVSAGNIVRIAQRLGPTYTAIAAAPVGVFINTSAVESRVDSSLISPAVGVVIGSAMEAKPAVDSTTLAMPVGVLVGSVATGMTPDGWLRGATGTITVTGVGLDSVATITATPATGLLFGAPAVSADGKSVNVSVSVAPDAEQSWRELRLLKSNGQSIPFAQAAASGFGIGSLPAVVSLSPIALEQGRGMVLTVRGTNLQRVIGAELSGGGVTVMGSQLVWGQDAYGEILSVPVQVDAAAPQGARVLRLRVFGGMTSAEPSVANTVTIVAPQ